MHPSSVDIQNEFDEVAVEAERLDSRLARIDPVTPIRDPQERWEATLVCASAAEKIYTGCERVMARLAAEIDGSPVIHSDGWHATLLRRVANPFPGVRGAIVSARCHVLLDRIRSFRHRERNSYGAQLDLDIVIERAREALAAFAMFRSEVEDFLEGA